MAVMARASSYCFGVTLLSPTWRTRPRRCSLASASIRLRGARDQPRAARVRQERPHPHEEDRDAAAMSDEVDEVHRRIDDPGDDRPARREGCAQQVARRSLKAARPTLPQTSSRSGLGLWRWWNVNPAFSSSVVTRKG